MKKNEIIKFGDYEWLVLDVVDDKALIITKDIITQLPYNNKHKSVNWKTSSLREYLNTDFLNSFLENEKTRISPTININEGNKWYFK